MIEQYVYDEFCEYLDISLELAQNALEKLIMTVPLNI